MLRQLLLGSLSTRSVRPGSKVRPLWKTLATEGQECGARSWFPGPVLSFSAFQSACLLMNHRKVSQVAAGQSNVGLFDGFSPDFYLKLFTMMTCWDEAKSGFRQNIPNQSFSNIKANSLSLNWPRPPSAGVLLVQFGRWPTGGAKEFPASTQKLSSQASSWCPAWLAWLASCC